MEYLKILVRGNEKKVRGHQSVNKSSAGYEEAYDQLFPLIYKELKRLAYSQLQSEHGEVTISGTELVHEVYLKMIDQEAIEAKNKSNFMAIAARCMRQILVDHAVKRKQKNAEEIIKTLPMLTSC